MRKFLSLAVMCGLALPATALAQAEPVVPAEPEPDTTEPMTVEELEGMEEEPAEMPETAMPEPPKEAADDLAAEYAPEDPEEGARPWLDGLSWQVMASAFYRLSGYTNDGVRAGPYNALVDDGVESGEQVGYPYTYYNGFGLNFAGGDLLYEGEKFGLRFDLRFGQGAGLLSPIAPIKQAYASWTPSDALSLDFGFFDTIYGAEVVDEWQNANYTRGALYFLRQPFNHLGVRAGAELGSILGVTFMVTNGGVLGGGAPIDDNETPALGWQFGLSPDGHRSVRRRGLRQGYREVGIFFGGNHAASGINANRDWEHFFDFVLSMGFDWFTLLLNGDYQISPNGGLIDYNQRPFAYGHSLALIFDAGDKFSIGIRGEHLSGNRAFRDFASSGDTGLATATLTFRYLPVEYLVLSLEGRGEWNTREIYFSRSAEEDANGLLIANKKQNYAVILGITAHIGN